MSLLRLENITKTYHLGEVDVPVLKGISFSVERGELIALMGASGSGKSTLMNVLGCLDRPTSGKYWLDGQEISSLAANERALVRTAKLGFVFQSFNLLPRTTAVNNVLMPLDYSTKAPSVRASIERAHEILNRVGLGPRLDHVPSQMSGGQQQRVAIARSLINEPALLLADEPTGNLDSQTSVEILEMFQQLNAAGLTVMLVTHDPKVAAYADRVIRVVDGLIVEDDHGGRSIDVSQRQSSAPYQRADAPESILEPNAAIAGDGDSSPGSGGVAVAQRRRTVVGSTQPASAITIPAPVRPARMGVAALVPAPLRTAATALRRNKMRSALTALGVIIGVGAVIAMVEISQGSRTSIMQTMASMGANTIMVRSGAAASGGISFGSGTLLTLTPGDADEIELEASAVAATAPVVQIQGQVVYGNRNWIPMNVMGTTAPYLTIRDWEQMDEGEMFTDRDVRNANKVCVIGQTLVKELFDGQSPIGEDLRVKNVSLRVIGVLGRKGSNMMGMDQDDVLLAPWTTVKYRISDNSAAATEAAASSSTSDAVNSLNELYPGSTALYPEQSATQLANTPQPVRFTNVDQIYVKARSAPEIPTAMDEITSILRQRHRIRTGQTDDFNLRDMSEMVKMMGSMSEMMGGLLMIVALISLVVGGVGIMNIMLVSVTERTREIGLRMAVGARSYHILRQFLIEAIVLCVFGGAVGIMLGRAASYAVWLALRWPVQASVPAIVGAFVVSATIGVAFGFYPAWKASRLDPIEALRYE
ncbi:ABC transporter permease [Lacipirellula limnantheis]|uniref:Macrolide export ATP-binding/permease protein MacB n=1 Tax=Lacipirellula limnantheis TaxID=2528024 RepID=A0A517U218_9BACT|nr:ABC transporter permease [Lacipirellula limnantheis]QDT74669.1 Macrolide export ATP-binding/permease protein MacB [Lacipirellula limnantheis]